MSMAFRLAVVAVLATMPVTAFAECYTATNGQRRCATDAYSTTVKSDKTTFSTTTVNRGTGATGTATPPNASGCKPGQPCIRN